VEQWEEEEGMEMTLLKKIISHRIKREMKKMDTQFQTQKTKINDIEEHSNAHKNTLKEEILQEITENYMEKMWLNKIYKMY
jgi:UDP-galactopyranose mutase